jgi:hypothetical protein
MGCTTEFSKWEGITFSPSRNQLYTAMSSVAGGMLPTVSSAGVANRLDVGGSQDVALPANACGCVYLLNVDASFNAVDMSGLVCGNPVATDANNACDVNSIASPDNVSIMPDFDTLLIGEDTSAHQNDAVWQYQFPNAPGAGNATGGTLTRMMAGPYGSELTSLYYQKLGNRGYIKTVVQHPFGESDTVKALDAPARGNTDAIIGFMGPIPVPAAATPAMATAWAAQPYAFTAALGLSGYTATSFNNATTQVAFMTALASVLGKNAGDVSITSVVDYTFGASSRRRSLMAPSAGVNVGFSVRIPTVDQRTVLATAVSGSGMPASLAAAMTAQGLNAASVEVTRLTAVPAPAATPTTPAATPASAASSSYRGSALLAAACSLVAAALLF